MSNSRDNETIGTMTYIDWREEDLMRERLRLSHEICEQWG
jgi:hypothetical protein